MQKLCEPTQIWAQMIPLKFAIFGGNKQFSGYFSKLRVSNVCFVDFWGTSSVTTERVLDSDLTKFMKVLEYIWDMTYRTLCKCFIAIFKTNNKAQK